MRYTHLVVLSLLFLSVALHADTITVRGVITQNALDTSRGSADNPSLDNVVDFEGYTIIITLANGTFNATGASFFNPGASAFEDGFQSVSLTKTSAGGFDTFTVFGCLNGYSCAGNTGGQLDLTFKILSAELFASSASATGIGTSPMQLLEDSGATDIHGSIDDYSFAASSTAVPEPTSVALLGSGLLAFACKRFRR
jgi:hypothetical protein